MAIGDRPCEPRQEMPLPASPQDRLPRVPLAHFISDSFDALDPSAFLARCAGGAGHPPFHPATLVEMPVCGYASGVCSSRRIGRRLRDDLELRGPGAGNVPGHRTFRDFRVLHLSEPGDRFVQLLRRAGKMGPVERRTVAIDGSPGPSPKLASA